MTSETKTRHYLALDGLRGVAALVVVVYHQRSWLGLEREWHGYLAVDFFYALSGFVIAHAYGSRLAAGDMPLLKFIRVRAIRLYPLIWLGAVVATLALLLKSAQDGSAISAASILGSFPFALLALPTPFLDPPFSPNMPVWSLFWEILANIAFGFFALRLTSRALILLLLISATGLTVATLSYGNIADFGYHRDQLHLGLVRVAFPFTAGICIHRLFETGRLDWLPALPLWALSLLLLAAPSMPVSYNHPLELTYLLGATLVLMPVIVGSGAGTDPRGLWMALARFSGEMSYPIYILHIPTYVLLDLSPAYLALPVTIRFPLAVGTVLIISFASSRLYDQPFRKWLSSFHRGPPQQARL